MLDTGDRNSMDMADLIGGGRNAGKGVENLVEQNSVVSDETRDTHKKVQTVCDEPNYQC